MGTRKETREPRARDFAGFLEDTDDLVTVVDRRARFLWVNHACGAYFGVEPDDCVGRSAFDFIHVEDQDQTATAFEAWVATPGTRTFSFENRQVAADGRTRYCLWTITRRVNEQGEFLHLASTAADITEIHAREARLARSEARLRALFRGTHDALVVIDDHGKVVDASESVREVFGWEPEDLLGRNINLLMPDPFRSEHDGHLARYRESGVSRILDTTREFPVVRQDGSESVCELSVSRVDVPGGETLFLGSFRDVSQRHADQRSLQQSEARFRAVFEQEFQFVGLLAPDGTLLEVNRSGLDSVRVDRDGVLGSALWEGPWFAHSAAEGERARGAVEEAMAGATVRLELEIVTHRGEFRTIDFSVKPLRAGDGEIQLLIAEGRDITELKRAQERETGMLRALASIGESASLLVHEIKNPITALNLALATVAEKLEQDQALIIEDLAARMRKLEKMMRGTLSFARPLELEPTRTDVSELLHDLAGLLAPEVERQGVELQVEVTPGLEAVLDRMRVEELLLNLLRNSLEALEESEQEGVLRTPGRVALRARIEAGVLVLEVEDDGPGIPARLKATLFEPFRTTRAAGTGLGLPLARKVAEAHGGTLEAVTCESGALLRARLPVAGGSC